MPKAKRALPTWTKEPPTEKVHIIKVKPKVTHQDTGVKRPKTWSPETVLKTKWK